MSKLSGISTRFPISFSILIVLLMYILIILSYILGELVSGYYCGREIGQFTGKLIASLVFVFILYRLGWINKSGLTKAGSWKYLIVGLFLLFYILLTAQFAYFGNIKVSIPLTVQSICVGVDMMGTGLVEEIVYRGIIFYCFFKLWGKTSRGNILAGIISALIFGASHMIWILMGKSVSLATLQSLGAFCSGIFYAGFVVRTKSIWPVVVIHGLTNAIINIRALESAGFEETFASGIIDILLSLPVMIYGLVLLKNNPDREIG